MSLKQMDILRYIYRNLIFGMVRFQVFFWVCLKYLIFWGVELSEIFVGYIADTRAQLIYQEKFRVHPPLGCVLIITLANYVKTNIRHVNCKHLQQYKFNAIQFNLFQFKLEDLVFT